MLSRILTSMVLGLLFVAVAANALQAWDMQDDPYDAATVEQDVGELRQDVRTDLAPTRKDIAEGGRAMEEEGHSAADSGPLEWQGDLALWTGLIFVVLMLVLRKYAWGPIADGLQRRESSIAKQIAEAEAANRDARQLLEEHRKRLDAAGHEVRQLLEQGRRDAEQSARRILDKARDDAKAEQQRALADIDQATTIALSELAAKSAELAVGLAGKIVKSELQAADHAELVRKAVKEFVGKN